MQFLAVAALLFIARVAAEQQPQEVSNAQPVPVSVGQQPQSGPVSQVVPVVSVEQPHQGAQHVSGVHHYSSAGQYPHQMGVSQYSPSGMVHVVNAADNKPYVQSGVQGGVPHYASAGSMPVGTGASVEQYGQPEPAGVPPNYKPFGSWGLYIGGNPADGYYSNYYKALSNSVDKQQVSSVEPQSVKPGTGSTAGVHQASAFGPMVKQASYPYNSYQDQVYPFDYYTTADLNSGSRIVAVDTQPAAAAVVPSTYAASGRMSPVQMGAQVYGSPVGSESQSSGPSQYADSSFAATSKRSATKDGQVQQQVQPTSGKGFAQKRYGYVYSPPAPQYGPTAAAGQQQPQVFAYPVPVGSQIVGSQPGAEGAFQPYGVHGYTRYAVKPTVVANSEQQTYYGVQSSPQYPVYKQYHQSHQYQYPGTYQQGHQHQQAPPSAGASFYGYPVSQLHYSQGSIVPAFPASSSSSSSSSVVEHQQPGNGVVGVNGPVSSVQFEAASSDKSQTEVAKPETMVQPKQQQAQHHQQQQQQKRA